MTSETAQNNSPHLSDEALDDLLLDVGSVSDAAHLGRCAICSSRLEMFRSPMAHFNQASSAWSEARSNSISRELTPRRSSFAILPGWSIAAAFFFAVALSFLVGIHRGITRNGTARVDAASSSVQVVDRQQEIASDNAMLHAIDTAISQPVALPVGDLEIEKTDSASPRRASPREVRD